MSDLLAPPAIQLRRRSTREPLALDPARELGAGGEARVLAVPGDDSLVAKLYHEPTLAKARKVALMMADEPALDASSATLAWPRDLLVDDRGRFAGFLMERAAGPRIFELYNPSTRRYAAPRGDHALLHRVGANVAAAFEALHARGYAIGDVNESNVLVRPGGAVTLVDTDSMQVPDRENGTVLRSRVGKAEFTPPELQGRSFADFDRSPEHDRFGLAVLLFLLLMEGTHPFAGRLEDGGEMPPIEERIRRGLFPHDDHAEIRPPRLAPDISILSPNLRALFVRCFEDGHADPSMRPTAAEWRAALAEAGTKLGKCRKNRCHRYGAHLDACPWCARTALLGGRDPFPEKAPPPPARQPRGTNRKGAVALRSVLGTAKKTAPGRAAATGKPAAPGRGAAGPRMAASALRAAPAPAPAPRPWPPLGPSGVQHPASWVVPAIALMFLGPAGLTLLGLPVLSVAFSWWLYARPGGRFTRDTVNASAGLLLVVLVVVAIVRVAIPGSPAAPERAWDPEVVSGPRTIPEPTGYPGDVPDLPWPRADLSGSPTRLGRVFTYDSVDAPPELLNRAEADRELAERLVQAGIPAGRVAVVRVTVRPDGTVDPDSVRAGHAADRELTAAAAPALAGMRFRPLTSNGVPIQAVLWIAVKHDG